MTPQMPRALLKQRRGEALADAMIRAGDPSIDVQALEASFKRLDVLDKLANAADRDARRDLKEGVVVAAGAVLVLSFLLLWRPEAHGFLSATASQVSVASERIDFTAQASWDLGHVQSSDGAFSKKKPYGNSMRQLRLTDIQQKSLVLRLEVGRVGECDFLKATDGRLVGVLWDLSGPEEVAYPWQLAADGRRPASLTICGTRRDPLGFRSAATALALAREVNYGDLKRDVEPVVSEGTVAVANEKLALSDADIVFLEAEGGRLDLAASGDAFRVRYSGPVKSLRTGAPGGVAERLPNALQRMAAGSPLATLYSALVGAVALIWGIRKLARGA